MLILAFMLVALGLTITMFVSRSMLLGFPSGIFWALTGGYAYTQSTIPWGDMYYYLFFASMGMVIFSMFAAYALRSKDIGEPDADREKLIDESGNSEEEETGIFAGESDEDDEKEMATYRERRAEKKETRKRNRYMVDADRVD